VGVARLLKLTRELSATLLIVFVLFCNSNLYAQITRYQYLINATNDIFQLLSSSAQPSPEAVNKVLAEACNALKLLLMDEHFATDLKAAIARSATSAAERKALRDNLALFTKEFLLPERAALEQAGLTKPAVDQIIATAKDLQTAVDRNADADKVLKLTAKLRDAVCSDAESTQERQNQTARLKKFAFFLTGVVLNVVDIAGTVPSGLVSDASIAIGSGLLVKSFE
jgi:hypothetical protein